MPDRTEKDMGYYSSSDSESQQNQHVFERPTGIAGIYCHPLTQVIVVV